MACNASQPRSQLVQESVYLAVAALPHVEMGAPVLCNQPLRHDLGADGALPRITPVLQLRESRRPSKLPGKGPLRCRRRRACRCASARDRAARCEENLLVIPLAAD